MRKTNFVKKNILIQGLFIKPSHLTSLAYPPGFYIGRYGNRGLMEQFDNFGNRLVIAALVICVLLLPFILWALFKLVFWAKGAPKGAYLFLVIFPLISLFPIPPPQFKNIEKEKQEQLKRKEDAGVPPDE